MLRFVGETHRDGMLVEGAFGARRETRYRLHAEPGTSLLPSDERCTVDGVALTKEVPLSGDHDVRCLQGGLPGRGFAPGHRSINVRSAHVVRPLAIWLPEDPRRWRRVDAFTVGGSVWFAASRDAQVGLVAGVPLIAGAWLGAAYIGVRVGPVFASCPQRTCEPEDGKDAEGKGVLFGIDARAYPHHPRGPNGFGFGLGARVQETVAWLPARAGQRRVAWFDALATLHFAFADGVGWAGDPGLSRTLIEAELGFGAAFARDDGLRVGFAMCFGLSTAFAI